MTLCQQIRLALEKLHFFATMRGLANFTDALSPKDSEFLCTFLLTNRIFLDSSVGRAPDC